MQPDSSPSSVTIRKAVFEDGDVLLGLIEELAHYEKLVPPDDAARARLLDDGFGAHPRYDVYLAEVNGVVCGYAFVFETYSTFLARPSLYLEDLFVQPQFRGHKAGLALFRKCVEEAGRRGCGRLEFVVLDWNTSAQEFYKSLGVKQLEDWCCFRLTADKFKQVLMV